MAVPSIIRIPVYGVDAFTCTAFSGNPAAVCLIDSNAVLADVLLQKIAAEFNLSETSFVFLVDGSLDTFQLRWFTPTNEVALCGHATLAAASVLFNGQLPKSVRLVNFDTMSGRLTAELNADRSITLLFPQNPPVPLDSAFSGKLSEIKAARSIIDNLTTALLPSLSVKSLNIAMEDIAYSPTTKKVLVRLSPMDKVILGSLKPDIAALHAVDPHGSIVRGVILTCQSLTQPFDFISRYFAPWNGINEDPVTGSAHTVMVPYWSDALKKDELLAFQASHRGGQLVCTYDRNSQRVLLAGTCCQVWDGTLTFDLSGSDAMI